MLRKKLGLKELELTEEQTRFILEDEKEVLEAQIDTHEYWKSCLNSVDGQNEILFALQYFSLIPLPVWAAARDGTIQHWNKYAERSYHYKSSSILGEDFIELFVNDPEKIQARKDLHNIIEGFEGPEHFNMAEDKDTRGRTVRVLTCCFPVYDPRIKDVVQAEISFDVNMLDQHQAELQELHEDYRNFKEQQRDAILQEKRHLLKDIRTCAQTKCNILDKSIEASSERIGDPKSTKHEQELHEKEKTMSLTKKNTILDIEIQLKENVSASESQKDLKRIRQEIEEWRLDDV